MDALSSGGLHQTGKDAMGFQSAFRSGSEADFAEDHVQNRWDLGSKTTLPLNKKDSKIPGRSIKSLIF